MTQRKRVAQTAIKKLERVKLEQGAELDGIMAEAVRNSPRAIGFVPAKVKPEFQSEVDQMVAVAEARKASEDAQKVGQIVELRKLIDELKLSHSKEVRDLLLNKKPKPAGTAAGFVLVSEETLLDIKKRVNTLATLSLKSERYSFGREIKQDIADMLAAPQGDTK